MADFLPSPLGMRSIKGGELFDKIVQLQSYSERDASRLIHQIVSAINHLHERSIVHRGNVVDKSKLTPNVVTKLFLPPWMHPFVVHLMIRSQGRRFTLRCTSPAESQ